MKDRNQLNRNSVLLLKLNGEMSSAIDYSKQMNRSLIAFPLNASPRNNQGDTATQ